MKVKSISTLLSLSSIVQRLASASDVMRGCQEPKVQQDFDLDAYLGLWYEQRRDKECTYEHGICSTANYSYYDDGTIRVLNNEWSEEDNEWGGGIGRATVVDPSAHEGYLKVKFVPIVPAGDYKILSTDYVNYTVVYTCSGIRGVYNREYAWVLTREAEPSEEIVEQALSEMRRRIPRYDMSQLMETP